MGFFVICAGVVLLQLSKSAKDVPDTAVFSGDLDQVRTIAEQEQPETEPKADAIRGTAAIIRRLSNMRPKMEMEEARRLHEEKQADLAPIGENEQFEWDGLRRRRTTYGTNHSMRSRGESTPFPMFDPDVPAPPRTPGTIRTPGTVRTPQQHPPLGMSHFPAETDSDEEERPLTRGSSVFTRVKSIMVPNRDRSQGGGLSHAQSPMHPVPLTEIAIPGYTGDGAGDTPYYGHDTEYKGAGGERHITIIDATSQRTGSRGSSLHPDAAPTPPPHSARRQFSFQNVFRKGQSQAHHGDSEVPPSRSPMIRKGNARKHSGGASQVKGATEEERLGLVKGDTSTDPLPPLDDEEDEWPSEEKRRDLTPPRRKSPTREKEDASEEEEYYAEQKRKWDKKQPPFDDGKGAFI